MEFDKKIKELVKLDREKFNDKEHFLYALKEIEKHLPELRELDRTKDPKLLKEIADFYIWGRILLETHKIDKEMIGERLDKFKEKVNSKE